MNGVSQGIEDGTDLIIDLRWQMDGIEGRNPHIFGEGTGHIDADPLGLGIEVKMPGARHAAFHADEVALAGYPVANFDGTHMTADLGDHA